MDPILTELLAFKIEQLQEIINSLSLQHPDIENLLQENKLFLDDLKYPLQ